MKQKEAHSEIVALGSIFILKISVIAVFSVAAFLSTFKHTLI